MWDVQREQPALLLPNDQVIFKDVTHQPTQICVPNTVPISENELLKMKQFYVLKKLVYRLIQDVGRLFMAEMGVGRAGAMIRLLSKANLAVGNPQNAANSNTQWWPCSQYFKTYSDCCYWR